jgi:CubicO group peptidase (beta-lactamase class C family)
MDQVGAFVDRGEIPGAVVGLWCDGEISLHAKGVTVVGGDGPITTDTLVRVSSNTKPVTAALAMSLIEGGLLGLDDPVERFVPELASRRVLRHLGAGLGETVPAERSITVEDLLTMRCGFGFVFEGDCPAVRAAADAGLGIGPPDPSIPLSPDVWIERFAELPLLEQPGAVWRYDLAFAVLGVVLARAAGQSLEKLFADRVLHPLGMSDTAFVAPPGRLPPCYVMSESGLVEFDSAEGSRWASEPAFPDARNGLVSTAADLLRFAACLLEGGGGVLSEESVAAMTTDHLTAAQRQGPSAGVFLDGAGWGYGLQVRDAGTSGSATRRRYGWGGGLGTLWYSWPEQRTAAVLLTQVLPPSSELNKAFTSAVEATLDRRPTDARTTHGSRSLQVPVSPREGG